MAFQQKDPLIGQEIDGYHIEKLLGQGGMARVYRALDIKLERYAAIKVIDHVMLDPKKYQARFDREARAIAKLRHPNIVAIYRFNEVNGLYYMAMEYIDGADLHWLLRDYQTSGELMDYDTLLQIMQQISEALDYAHENGVIHRDIKPSNIMLSRDGHAVLTDFGLALDVTQGTQGEIFGSPHYIAPEQAINSAKVKAQTDIYSLGVVLYEILTGKVPFSDGTTFEIAMAHISEPLPDPLSINPDLHPAFIPVLNKVLEKDTDTRYPTCAELMVALRAAVDEAVQANKIPQVKRHTRPVERIAQRVAPLPPAATALKPLMMSPENSAVEVENTAPEAVQNAPIVNTSRSRTPLLAAVVVLILLSIGGYVALDYLGVNVPHVPGIGVQSAPATNGIIEGRVTGINGATIMVYDMAVTLDRNYPLLDRAQELGLVGRLLRIEGRYIVHENGVEFTYVASVLVDNHDPTEEEAE